MSRNLPKFLGEMGGKGCEQAKEIVHARFEEFYIPLCAESLVFLKGIQVFHQSRNGGIEGKGLQIPSDIFGRVVADIIQFFFRGCVCFYVIVFGFCRFSYQAFDSVGKFCDGLDAVVIPGPAFRITETEHEIETEYVGSVLFNIFIRRNDVSFGF